MTQDFPLQITLSGTDWIGLGVTGYQSFYIFITAESSQAITFFTSTVDDAYPDIGKDVKTVSRRTGWVQGPAQIYRGDRKIKY